jgi:hypothetical protein
VHDYSKQLMDIHYMDHRPHSAADSS